jgi:hypothetical protein
MELNTHESIQQFTLQVLPSGLHRILHLGLLAGPKKLILACYLVDNLTATLSFIYPSVNTYQILRFFGYLKKVHTQRKYKFIAPFRPIFKVEFLLIALLVMWQSNL